MYAYFLVLPHCQPVSAHLEVRSDRRERWTLPERERATAHCCESNFSATLTGTYRLIWKGVRTTTQINHHKSHSHRMPVTAPCPVVVVFSILSPVFNSLSVVALVLLASYSTLAVVQTYDTGLSLSIIPP